LKDLEQQACSLGADERAQLAETLLESLRVPVSAVEQKWEREIADRVAAYDRGELPSYAAEEVFAEARNLFR
jgi:putative addiction module component (TIGR02574 family)